MDPVTGHQTQPSRSAVFEAGCLEVVTQLFRRHLLYCGFVTLCSALLQVYFFMRKYNYKSPKVKKKRVSPFGTYVKGRVASSKCTIQ